MEARSGVEAMSLGPESLTSTLCDPRYRSHCESIMAQTCRPTASDMAVKRVNSHSSRAPGFIAMTAVVPGAAADPKAATFTDHSARGTGFYPVLLCVQAEHAREPGHLHLRRCAYEPRGDPSRIRHPRRLRHADVVRDSIRPLARAPAQICLEECTLSRVDVRTLACSNGSCRLSRCSTNKCPAEPSSGRPSTSASHARTHLRGPQVAVTIGWMS
jgi:hypothetical protein